MRLLPQTLEDVPTGQVGLRWQAGDIRRDRYIDTEHDFICVRWIWWKKRFGDWVREREYILSDLVQLPGGQWYARRKQAFHYANPETGVGGGRHDLNIDVKVLKEDELPPDVFNGEKLLEGVKKIISY